MGNPYKEFGITSLWTCFVSEPDKYVGVVFTGHNTLLAVFVLRVSIRMAWHVKHVHTASKVSHVGFGF